MTQTEQQIDLHRLKNIASQVRRDIVRMVHACQSGHPGGSLGCTDVVTAEEHQLNGGLGDAVCQVLSRHLPTPVEMIGVNNSFGESGTPAELMKKYGLDAATIVKAAKKVIQKRK